MHSKTILKTFLFLFTCVLAIGCANPNQPIQPKKMEIQEKTYQSEDEKYLDHYLDAFLPNGYTLPNQTPSGASLSWKVMQGEASIDSYVLHKKETAQEYEPIVLTASTSNGETYTFDHLLLLDEYVGYLISYFSKKGEEKETLKLAYTYNGYYWFNINDGKMLLRPSIGTGSLRDPSVVRKKDGSFTLIATQGFDTNAIYAYDTKDFITFEKERLLQVNKNSSTLPMSETQAWAPEGFYDRTLDQYVLYWSSVNDLGMFYNYSSDLNTFSYPKRLFDVGYEVIDGTIVKEGATYYIVAKDEREPYQEHSQLFFSKPSDDYRSFHEFEVPFTDHENEGPMVFKDLEGDGYYVFYDNYTKVWFRAVYMKDLAKQEFTPLAKNDLMIPLVEPGHSSAIPVTWKELERLFAVYSY